MKNGFEIELKSNYRDGNIIVAEIKAANPPDQTFTQLQICIKHIKSTMTGKNISGTMIYESYSVVLKDAAETSDKLVTILTV